MSGQLRCRDLRPGDLMLKLADGSLVGHAIQAGQTLTGGEHSGIVHAGVMFDSTFIIEAQGKGISANDLRVQNEACAYHVYRCNDRGMADGAGTCAKLMFDIHQRGGNLGYSVAGAIGSLFNGGGGPAKPGDMDALLDRILAGREHRFFCSQFVVYVYQFVAEQCGVPAARLFNLPDAKVPPSLLTSLVSRHPVFTRAGSLAPHER